MKRKTMRKVKEVEEEKKEALLPAPTLAEQSQPDMEISQEKSQEVLLMRTVTWLRDSHSLFDYESRQIQKRNLKIEHSCNFIRTKDEVKTVSETDTGGDDPETKPLFSLIKDKDGKYYIDVIRKENTDKLWLVVRALNWQNQRLNYEMRQNDIVKLGRVLFKVKEIRSQRNEKDSNRYIMFEDDMKEVSSILVENEELPDFGDSSSSPIWRVWWGAEWSQENPLINACWKWIGGMRYIHLNCLKCWVKSKSKVTTPEKKLDCLESFVWSSFKWEICKTKYPWTLKHNDSYYNIFDITRPSGPYWILESISVDENGSKMIFVIKPNADEWEYLIGRGHDSDIRISDISVSRCHAKIICKDGKFMLKDNGSKFGTLVQINEKWPIITNHTWAIQSGRTVGKY